MNHLFTKSSLLLLFVCLFASGSMAQSSMSISMEEYYQEGLLLHEEGNYVDAEPYYDLAISMNPSCGKCFFNRGLVRSMLEKNNKALADFNSLIEIDPTDIEAYEQRGNLRYLTGNTDGAISDLSTVISGSPSAAAYTNRGIALLDMKQYPDALRDLVKAVRLDAADGEARRILGDVYFAINQTEDALLQYNEAIRLNERDIIAYNNRGNAYQVLGKDEEALADYNAGIILLENSFTYTNRAKYWIKKENYESALIDGRAATKLDFNNPEAYYCVGLVENRMKNYELAAENFNKAVALDHSRADYYNGRGLALFHLKQYKDAQSDFESALALNPADAAAKDRISDCYKMQEGRTAVVAAMQGEMLEEENEEDEFTERGIPLVSYNVIGERKEIPVKNRTRKVEDKNNVIALLEKQASEEEEGIGETLEEEEEEVIAIESESQQVANLKNKSITKYSFQTMAHPAGEVFTERGVIVSAIKKEANSELPIISMTSSTDQALQYMDIANKHLQMKWYEQAIQQYTAALNTDATLKEAYYKRAQCYMLTKQNKKAITDLDEYLLIVPENADAFNDRGSLRFRTGNIFGAQEDYNAGLAINSQHALLHSNRGRWYMYMGYFAEAVSDFTRAIESKEARADIYYQRGLAHFELQKYTAVIADMNQAIDKSSIDRYEYYFLSAKAQLISLQYESALQNLNKTIELSPRFAEGYMYRAVTYRQMDLKPEACENYQMAASLGFKAFNKEGVGRYCEGD